MKPREAGVARSTLHPLPNLTWPGAAARPSLDLFLPVLDLLLASSRFFCLRRPSFMVSFTALVGITAYSATLAIR
jgi:hypothetical protein